MLLENIILIGIYIKIPIIEKYKDGCWSNSILKSMPIWMYGFRHENPYDLFYEMAIHVSYGD
jgi:hypothetical protein